MKKCKTSELRPRRRWLLDWAYADSVALSTGMKKEENRLTYNYIFSFTEKLAQADRQFT